MNILFTLMIIIIGIIAFLLFIALFMKKDYTAYSEMMIEAPLQKVFDYLIHIKNQDEYNKWVMKDPQMKRDFTGEDGTVGFVYAWNGNKDVGEGEQEIMAIEEGKFIEMEIRFVRPFAGIAHAKMMTEPISANQTKISWHNASKMKYPMNLLLSSIVKMLEKDMASSLSNLKNILEK